MDYIVATKEVNLTFYRGQDLDIDVTLNPVIDITGMDIVWTMRQDYRPLFNPTQVQKAVGSGITITDGPNAQFTIHLDSADTAHLPLGAHVHDCQEIDNPPRDPFFIGTITLLDLVNRAP